MRYVQLFHRSFISKINLKMTCDFLEESPLRHSTVELGSLGAGLELYTRWEVEYSGKARLISSLIRITYAG